MKVETIAQKLFFTTLLLQGDFREDPSKTQSATSFILSYAHEGKIHYFLVTNWHCVEDKIAGRMLLIRADKGEPLLQNGFVHEIAADRWEWHHFATRPEVDLTIMPFDPIVAELKQDGIEIYFQPVLQAQIPTAKQFASIDALDEVVFVGYPGGVRNDSNNVPALRHGMIATPPQLDYDGLPLFLVDATSFAGSSGSPVFSYRSRVSIPHRSGTLRLPYLVGIYKGNVQPPDGGLQGVNLHLGVVLRPSLLLELLQDYFIQRSKSAA